VSKSVEGIQILFVHVMYHQLLVGHLSKENQVAIWINGDHIADITIKVTQGLFGTASPAPASSTVAHCSGDVARSR